jgi:transcriptional regulator with GAF, ATPase, and Fis domain/GGDEF domain-containing protein
MGIWMNFSSRMRSLGEFRGRAIHRLGRIRGQFAADGLDSLQALLDGSASEWGRRALFVVGLAGLLLLFERFAPTIALAAAAWIVLSRRRAAPAASLSRKIEVRRVITRDSVVAAEESLEPTADIIPLNNAFAPAWVDVDDFLQATLDILKTRFKFQTANIFLRGDDPKVLIQRAYVSTTNSVARLATIRVGQGLVGWVAANKRPLIAGNLRHEGRSMGYYRTAGEQVSSFAAVPIISGEAVVGVLSLDDAASDAFTSTETEPALVAVAGLLARVLGAEEVRDQAVRTTDRVEAVRRIVRTAYEAGGLDDAAEAALKELVTLADFHSIAVYLLDQNGEPSRRAGIGFHGIQGNMVKEPIMRRAVTHAIQQASPFRLEGVALAAQYRTVKAVQATAPELLIAYPILHRGQALGALVVETADRKVLDDRIEGILADTVNDLGGAFVRVYRAAQAEGAARVEAELIRFSSSLLTVENTEQIWEQLFSVLLFRTRANAAVAYRRTEKGYALESVAGCSPIEDLAPLDEGLMAWTALAGRPVIASREDRRRPPIEEGESYLAFPIGPAREPHSVVVLASSEANAFDPAAMEIVSGMAETVHPMLLALDRLEEARAGLEIDAVTGVWNETGFRKRIGVMAIGSEVSVVAVDVRNWSDLLAHCGRREAQSFLRRVANMIETVAGRGCAVVRLDGGRFAVAFKGPSASVRAQLQDVFSTSTLGAVYEMPIRIALASASGAEGIRWEELLDAAESRLGRPAFAAPSDSDEDSAEESSEPVSAAGAA